MTIEKNTLPELLTLKEASKVLKCHPNTLRLWDKDGTLNMIRFGKRKIIRYRKEDILNLLEKRDSTPIGEREMLKQLEDSKREIDELVSNTPDIIARFDQNFRHVFVNTAIEKVSGMPKEKFIGKSNKELGMPENLVNFWHKKLASVFKFGKNISYEFSFTSKSKKYYYQTSLIPEKDNDGIVKNVLAISRDITKFKESEDVAKYQINILENVSDCIIVTDLKGKITYWNKGAEKIFGYTE